jgi:PAS domain S-box-containing protein
MATSQDFPLAGPGPERASASQDPERERQLLAWRLELLSRWSGDMVLLVDDQRRLADANQRALELLGYGREELLALQVSDLRDPAEPSRLDARLAELRAGGRAQWETRFRRRDGTTFPVEAEVHLARWDGRDWFHAVVRDLSERKRTEEALLASEARFRAAFDGVPIGMALLDGSGQVLETNRALQEMVDLGEGELRGRPALERIHPEDADATREAFRRVREGPVQVDTSCRYRRRDGTYAETRFRVRALTDAAGTFRFALVMVEDVSDRRRMEAQLRLADRLASVGTLAAGVAHEINNPLAFVLANLEYAIRELRSGRAGPEVVTALEEAREGGARVREIVRDLKTFSRADDSVRERLDVARVLRSAISLAANELRSRARLEVELEPTAPVLASEHRLGQVFLNLLINAAQAIPEGQTEQHLVRASAGMHPDGRVRVEVSDDGAGIPPEIRARIFDPFFTTKAVGVGTGLGLSICHGIVAGLGGEITVEGEPGKGSTFRVLLPAAPAAGESPAAPAPPLPVRRARVLVVDDEPLVRRAVQRILSPPHDVQVQSDGREALATLLGEGGYDLVLCDLMMPGMSGMELHRRVAERAPALAARFVFLTGGAFTPGARDFLQRVPNPRVEKPFEPAALRELVLRLLAEPGAGG